jgi:nucleoside-diphosphate-sugar epimerase
MPIYAVTGASGHLGGFAVQQLLPRGVPPSSIVAVVRTRGKADDLAARGVQVRMSNLLGRTATRPAEVVHMAYDLLKGRPRMATPGVIGVACPHAPDTSAI